MHNFKHIMLLIYNKLKEMKKRNIRIDNNSELVADPTYTRAPRVLLAAKQMIDEIVYPYPGTRRQLIDRVAKSLKTSNTAVPQYWVRHVFQVLTCWDVRTVDKFLTKDVIMDLNKQLPKSIIRDTLTLPSCSRGMATAVKVLGGQGTVEIKSFLESARTK